jgi:hypothetical protein
MARTPALFDTAIARLTDFIREWRDTEGKAPKAFVPLTFEPGEAFQFDWSDEGMVVGGLYYKLQVAHLKLCFSRAFWLVAYPSQGHEMLFDAHTRSFIALGGIVRDDNSASSQTFESEPLLMLCSARSGLGRGVKSKMSNRNLFPLKFALLKSVCLTRTRQKRNELNRT